MFDRLCGFRLLVLCVVALLVGCGEESDKRVEKSPSSKSPDGHSGKSGSKIRRPEKKPKIKPVVFNIPDRPVAGTIRGLKFRPDRGKLDSGWLKLTVGKGAFPDTSFTAMLHIFDGESVDGRTFEFQVPPRSFGAPMINVKWKPPGERFSKSATINNYALKLVFGKRKRRSIDGRLHFRSLEKGDAGTEFAGTFTAEISPDLKEPPTDDDAPYVYGKIAVKAGGKFKLSVGMTGLTTEGKRVGNSFGSTFTKDGGGSGASLTFEPQITALRSTGGGGFEYRHIGLKPGTYLVYVKLDDRIAAWKWIDVGAKAKITHELEIDSAKTGTLEVNVADQSARSNVTLIPLQPDGSLPKGGERISVAFRLNLSKKPVDGKAVFEKLPAGRYRVQLGPHSMRATVEAGKTVRLTLSPSN